MTSELIRQVRIRLGSAQQESCLDRRRSLQGAWGLVMACALGLAGCLGQDEGIVVDVSLMQHPGGGALEDVPVTYREGEPRGTVSDLGYDVVIREAFLVVDSIELLPCDRPSGSPGERPAEGVSVDGGVARRMGAGAKPQHAKARVPFHWQQVWRALSPVSVARAHGSSTPLHINQPHILNLIGPDRAPRYLSNFTPPPNDYCGVRVRWAPADPHALGIESEPRLLGWTAWMEGTVFMAQHREPLPFRWRIDEVRDVELAFVDSEGEPARLELWDSAVQETIDLRLGYGTACAVDTSGTCRGLFDQVDLLRAEASPQVLDNLIDNLRAVVRLAR